MQATLPELEELAGLPTLTLPDGQLLFDPARACLGFPLVGKGSIKVFPNGREILLSHVTPGQTCVVSAACLFLGLPYGASAATQGPVELRLIPPAAFDRLMNDTALRRFVMAQFTQRLSDLMALLDAVFTHRLDQRLGLRLVAHEAGNGSVCAMTHQQLADELGSIRDVVSRLLKQFADEGWIRIARGAIHILALDQLKRFAAEPM